MAVRTLEAALSRLETDGKKRSRERSKASRTSSQRASGGIQRSCIMQLPLWRDDRRGVPNDIVRSALFTVGNRQCKRSYLTDCVISAIGDVEIGYTGEELRQDDEDVFLQLLHLARLSDLGDIVVFSARSLLTALRWSTDARSYTRLKASITRLSANTITVRTETRGYSGSLIRDFQWKGEQHKGTSKWTVRFEPRIVSLFGKTAYTQILWEQRLELGNLAKWLHSFFATHAKPFPMKAGTLHRLCGSKTKQPRKFRQMLRMELEELVRIGFLESWTMDSSTLVHVVRTPAETRIE